MSFETFVGWRYLKAKRKQSFISIISFISLGGVALGVAALIVVLAVMSGTKSELKKRILNINSHIFILKYGRAMNAYQSLIPLAQNVPGVLSVDPFVYGQTMATAAGGVAGAVVRGVDFKSSEVRKMIEPMVIAGSIRPAGDQGDGPGKVLLGVDLAEKLGVKAGSVIQLLSPTGGGAAGSRSILSKRFQVSGIVESGMYDYDSILVYMPLKQARSFMGLGSAVTGLQVSVDNVDQVEYIREEVQKAVGPSYWIRDWKQMNHNLFTSLELQKAVMFIILSLTVLVAAFNIISTLTMLVMEKNRDIAILKTMGAGRRTIMKIFVFQGLFIGFLGAAAGLAGGLILCAILNQWQIIDLPGDVYYLRTLPVDLRPLDVGVVLASAILVSLLAAIIPAWQASKLNPLEVLRYE